MNNPEMSAPAKKEDNFLLRPVRPLLESLNRNKGDILAWGAIFTAVPLGVAVLGYSFNDPYMMALVPKIVVAEAVAIHVAAGATWLFTRGLNRSHNG